MCTTPGGSSPSKGNLPAIGDKGRRGLPIGSRNEYPLSGPPKALGWRIDDDMLYRIRFANWYWVA